MLVEIDLSFEIDRAVPPPNALIHDALEGLRSLSIEATSSELAELWADVLRLALLDAANGVECPTCQGDC